MCHLAVHDTNACWSGFVFFIGQITAYPGESVPFGVQVVDNLNLPTVGVFRFSNRMETTVYDFEVSYMEQWMSLHINPEAPIAR